jgi:hypothetical protein
MLLLLSFAHNKAIFSFVAYFAAIFSCVISQILCFLSLGDVKDDIYMPSLSAEVDVSHLMKELRTTSCFVARRATNELHMEGRISFELTF